MIVHSHWPEDNMATFNPVQKWNILANELKNNTEYISIISGEYKKRGHWSIRNHFGSFIASKNKFPLKTEVIIFYIALRLINSYFCV